MMAFHLDRLTLKVNNNRNSPTSLKQVNRHKQKVKPVRKLVNKSIKALAPNQAAVGTIEFQDRHKFNENTKDLSISYTSNAC